MQAHLVIKNQKMEVNKSNSYQELQLLEQEAKGSSKGLDLVTNQGNVKQASFFASPIQTKPQAQK